MTEMRQESQAPSLGLKDILFAICKHKGKILACAAAGFVAAIAVYIFYPLSYESQAKLLVRYVVDRSAVDPIESAAGSTSNKTTDSVLGSEVEILTSWDLAVEVAQAIGPKKLLPNAGDRVSTDEAAATISDGLDVSAQKGSDIIFASYKNRNPELVTIVLQELVNRYFVKHLEVHRSAAAFDFVSQQTDQVRARLNQTEETLRTLKNKAGIVSLADSNATLSTSLVRTEEDLHAAEAELAEQRARVKQIEQLLGKDSSSAFVGKSGVKSAEPSSQSSLPPDASLAASHEDIEQYQALVTRLAELRTAKLDLGSKYTAENQLVRQNQIQIDDLERRRRNLEKKFPDLGARVSTTGSQQPDLFSEKARLAGVEAKVESLKQRLGDVQAQMKQLSDVGPQIADAERQKELEETNYKYFEATLEKARVDEALDPTKMPNISAVQKPSPPNPFFGKRNKVVLALAGGGLALGLALALLIELLLNPTIKRPAELESQLHALPLVSIPYNQPNGHSRPRLTDHTGTDNALAALANPNQELAPWDLDHFIRPYTEAIRDRLGLYFKLNGMTRKPKLVGVTGFSEGAGSSTLAAGLAAALSETGDGKVLLVDVNVGAEHVHPFFRGRPAYPLTTALQPSGPMAPAADGLYLATVVPPNAGPMQLVLKRLFDLMPNLKASDFDYIIFDMPHLSQTSPTLGMAGFMDKVLLVMEAEKSDRDFVKRSYAELIAARANVSIVFNKARSYVPKWLERLV